MNPPALRNLRIKIYADGADLESMTKLAGDPLIAGLTTNPTLMKKAGISDYERFSRQVLAAITEKPVSLEVFADDFPSMKTQALKISGWGPNVFVKIPITNTRGESSLPLIGELASTGVALNITALVSATQVEALARILPKDVPAVASVFAGRIADTGLDPVPVLRECRKLLQGLPRAELLWASVREVLNLRQAAESRCHIVTVPHDILAKAKRMWGMDLSALSLDTVTMFHKDAVAAGFRV